MGVVDQMAPILGETYIEMVEHFTKVFNPELNEDEIIYSVVAEDRETLFQAPLETLLGETEDHYWRSHYPLTTWGDETERTDFWSDGVADTLRTLNKIMNAWFSQEVENRTLRNFGMNYFNSSLTDEGFTPQSFTPEPGGWYPIPAGEKTLSDQFMHVDIPDLGQENFQAIEFIKTIAEQASAATTFQQGEQAQSEVTLGEVKILLANAQERVKSMAVYYTDSWRDFGVKYIKLLEGSGHLLNPLRINRHGRLTKKIYTKVISPQDWEQHSGFKVDITMKSEKQQEDMNSLQWLNASRSIMPSNPIVDEEYKKKLLENGGLSSDKIVEALKFDKQMTEELQQAQAGQLARTQHPSESMNYKDLPPQAQQGMLSQAGLVNQPQTQAAGNGSPQSMPNNPSIQPPQLPSPQAAVA